jgi:hypothetical protein
MFPLLILIIIVILALLIESDSEYLLTDFKRIGNHFIDLIYQPKSAGKTKQRTIFPYSNWKRKSKRPRKKR